MRCSASVIPPVLGLELIHHPLGTFGSSSLPILYIIHMDSSYLEGKQGEMGLYHVVEAPL